MAECREEKRVAEVEMRLNGTSVIEQPLYRRVNDSEAVNERDGRFG